MNKVYGYARISTPQQNIERQIRNIRASYPTAHVIEEAYTGTTMNRPSWQQLLRRIRPGDTIVFDSVSRMSRDAEEGFTTYKELTEQGVYLVFLKEPHVNTETFQNATRSASTLPASSTGDKAADNLVNAITAAIHRYQLALIEQQIKLAFDQAQKEVDDLRQRTREGIETARLNGKQIGRRDGEKLTTKKSIQAKEIIKQHSKTFGGTLSDNECMKLCGVARNTYFKYKRELKDSI